MGQFSQRATRASDSPCPRVSFIIPAFNARRTLDETLDSVLAQDVRDWEAVIVDDGSTDRTFAVARRRAAADPRIRCFRQRNAGASSARNAALLQARGRWVVFLDADDWIAPDFLSTLSALLEGRGEDHLAYCSYVRVTPEGEHTPPDWRAELQDTPFEFLARRCEPAIHCVMVSRALVMEVGGFDPDLANCEDWDLWLRIARTGARFVGTPRPLAFYRMRLGSLSTLNAETERNSRIVLTRATQQDPRVPRPDPRFAAGVPTIDRGGRSIDQAVLRAARALIAGEAPQMDWLPRLDHPAERRALLEATSDLGSSIVTAFTQARGAPAAEARLDAIWPLLTALVAAIEPAIEGFGAVLAGQIARELLFLDPLETPRLEGRYLGMRLDISQPLPKLLPDQGAETLVIQVCARDETLFHLEIPVLGGVSALAVAEQVLWNIPVATLIAKAGLLARPSFLAAAGQALARALPGLMRAPRRAGLARAAVGDALRQGALRALAGSARPVGSGAAIAAEASAAFLRQTRPPTTPNAGLATPVTPVGAQEQLSMGIPILLFPRIVETRSGPLDEAMDLGQFDELIAFLRRNGYRASSFAEFDRLRRDRDLARGRPVILAFDDRDALFGTHLLPRILQSGFGAEVLVTIDRLRSAEERGVLRGWQNQGVGLAYRAELLPMDGAGWLAQAAQARAALSTVLGVQAAAALPPELNSRYHCLLADAGFDIILTQGDIVARTARSSRSTPTIECGGQQSLGMLVELLRDGD